MSTALTSVPAPPPLALRWRILISALVALHVAAVFIGPWAMAPSTSALSGRLASAFRPYLRMGFLDNGYRFFAPEPGPAHLIRYDLKLADGSEVNGVFPSIDQQWPRLLYHRHFMLSEFVNTLDGQEQAELRDAMVKSFARHLVQANQAEEVSLYLRRHLIAPPQEVAQGAKLDDPRSYPPDRPLGTFTAEQLR
jgi:hypothetical protein